MWTTDAFSMKRQTAPGETAVNPTSLRKSTGGEVILLLGADEEAH